MSIAPIVRTVSVAVSRERAFDLFSGQMGRWWSPQVQIASTPFAAILLEPRAGGRWFERDAAGKECDWGVVLAWEPPGRLLLGWQLDAQFRYDPDLVTEVEISFEEDGSGTRVTLTHRNLERFGPTAAATAAQLGGGWPGLMQRFATFVEEETTDD